MLHTFFTLEIWEKYSLIHDLFFSGKISSKEKMQEIFFKEETKCADPVLYGPKMTMIVTSNTIIF